MHYTNGFTVHLQTGHSSLKCWKPEKKPEKGIGQPGKRISKVPARSYEKQSFDNHPLGRAGTERRGRFYPLLVVHQQHPRSSCIKWRGWSNPAESSLHSIAGKRRD